MTKSHNVSIRISEAQLNDIRIFAEYSGSSVCGTILEACRLYCPQTAHLKKAEKTLKASRAGDTELLRFPGDWSESKNRIKLYVHTAAFADLKNLGKKVEAEFLEFFESSIRDGSILHKGQITTTEEGLNFICFRVNLVKINCYFAPMQITVLSVTE